MSHGVASMECELKRCYKLVWLNVVANWIFF